MIPDAERRARGHSARLEVGAAGALRLGIVLLGVALTVHLFAALSRVLLLVYAAAILAVALNALARPLPLRRRWAAALIGILILGVIGMTIWFGGQALLAQLRGLAARLPQLESELRAWGDWLRAHLGLDVRLVGERTENTLRQLLPNLGRGRMLGRAWGIVEAIGLAFMILIGGLFALAEPNKRLLVPLMRMLPATQRAAWRRMLDLLTSRLRGWIRGTLISMATIGVLATAAFYLIGVPYPLVLGVVVGLMEFVPILGPFVGGLAAVVVAFLAKPILGLWTLLAVVAIQQVESHLVTPLVMQDSAELHPFVTLFAVLLFGGLFGLLGILLALPLAILTWTVLQVFWVERAIGTADDRIRPVVED